MPSEPTSAAGYLTDVAYPRAFVPQIAPSLLRLVAPRREPRARAGGVRVRAAPGRLGGRLLHEPSDREVDARAHAEGGPRVRRTRVLPRGLATRVLRRCRARDDGEWPGLSRAGPSA